MPTGNHQTKPTVAKHDLAYFDWRRFATPEPGQHWADARREQLAAIKANPDKVRAAEALHEGQSGRRTRRRRRATVPWPSLAPANDDVPLRERFPLMLPPRPYCSNNVKTDGMYVRPRDIALRHRQIQLNGPNAVQFLLFDIDRKDAFFAAEDAGA
jgi:hypothetical protein